MNWFKHYANMATDERMMRMESEMGYIGTGIFWRAMELINGMGGSYPLKGLLYTIKNRHAKQGKVMQVIMGYGLFEVDSVGLVRFCEVSKRALAEPSQLPNGTASEDAIIGTRVVEREEKKREEENTLLNPPCEEVDDSVDKGRVDELTVSCHPEQSEGSVNASNRDDTGGRNQILHSVNSVQDDKVSDNNTIPRDSVPSVSSVVCSSIIHELRTNRSWQEAVCITSGYGALLMRHFNRAVDIFLQHVKAGADEVELSDRRRAMNYFRNFTRLSHPAGRRLKEELEKMEQTHLTPPETHLNPPETHLTPPCEGGLGNSTDNDVRSIQAPSLTGRDGVGLSPFEDPPGPNGERSYHGGRPLPPDAPPRPSPQAEWDEAEGKWWEGWTLPPWR